jgi:peptide methionine sulfoxide reductase MsrA
MEDFRKILKIRLLSHEADRDSARVAYQVCDKDTIEYEMAKMNYSSAVIRINELLAILNHLDEKQA